MGILMKIYCLGLSRTGTTTFSDFLRRYGFNIIHYPSSIQLQMGMGDGASDIPVVPVYKQLDKSFPNSKFVHLVRDNWVDAVEPYFLRKKGRVGQASSQLNLRAQVFGSVDFDRKLYADAYKRHDEDVREYFKDRPNDLLIMNIVGDESPKRLLDFLGLPDKGFGFPKSNSRETTWK